MSVFLVQVSLILSDSRTAVLVSMGSLPSGWKKCFIVEMITSPPRATSAQISGDTTSLERNFMKMRRNAGLVIREDPSGGPLPIHAVPVCIRSL